MHLENLFIGRQPIMNRDHELFAYQLKLHQFAHLSDKSDGDPLSFMEEVENTIGFQAVTGPRCAFMDFPRDVLIDLDWSTFTRPEWLVIEVDASLVTDVGALQKLKNLKRQGASIALNHFDAQTPAFEKLLPVVDWVKIRAEAVPSSQIKPLVDRLQHCGLEVIATHIETEAAYQQYAELGFDYFQGYFFIHPMFSNSEPIDTGRQALLQLLVKINDPETELEPLVDLIRHHAVLSHNLLVVLQQVQPDLPSHARTVSQAVQFLGLKRIKFWVNTLLLSAQKGVPSELMTVSLTRAKFCEQMAVRLGRPGEQDAFFMTGLFSCLDAVFRVPLQEAIKPMAIAEDMKSALLTGTGEKGQVLGWVQSLEQGEPPDMSRLESQLVKLADCTEEYLRSIAWAQSFDLFAESA